MFSELEPRKKRRHGRRQISLNIEGDVGPGFLSRSRHITCFLNGDASRLLGQAARYLEITAYGDVGARCGESSIFCTFKSSKQTTVDTFLKYVPENEHPGLHASGNKIIFIKQDGTEEVVKHYMRQYTADY